MNKFLVGLGLFLFSLGIFAFILISSGTKEKANKVAQNPSQVAGVKDSPSPTAISTNSSADYDFVTVKRVVDGDTIELETGQKVRYIGINTPETVDPRSSVQCFGKEASDENKKLVEGKTVRLEKDTSETDKYGRLLRYVYFEAGGKEIFVNLYLVAQGFAQASSYPPDVKYQDMFSKAQKEAAAKNLGLWLGCSGNKSTSSVLPACNIKGNISSSGEKIYHQQNQKYYNSTVVDTSKGEKYFCSPAEAEAAGFRPSKI